jgi:hypothetical protein
MGERRGEGLLKFKKCAFVQN